MTILFMGVIIMRKLSAYVPLEISGDRLDNIIIEIRDKIVNEFWSSTPSGTKKKEIEKRIEQSIKNALGISL